MQLPKTHDNNHEAYPGPDSIFPLAPNSVVAGLANLENSSNQMLEMITYARGPKGAANELYTNLPIEKLIDWHVDNHDFTSGGELLYRVGLLYGVDLASRIVAEIDVTEELKFTDTSAFVSALGYLRETYRGLDDVSGKPEWLRQKERELLYTGSDILTLANAAHRDSILRRLKEHGVDPSDDELAQHVGLIDGAIFTDAYRSYIAGRRPMPFGKPVVEYVPVFNPRLHAKDSASDLSGRYEFENLNEVLQTIEMFNRNQGDLVSRNLADNSTIQGIRRFVQIDTNGFVTALEIKQARLPQRSWRRIGAVALPGAAIDAFYMVGTNLPVSFVPLATLMNTGIGLYFERSRRSLASRRFEEDGIPVVGA